MIDSNKILLIDDDPNASHFIQTFLEINNFIVTTATNGKNGIEEFTKCPFDIVITDLYMPEISGEDVIKSIRKISQTTSIIVITGFASADSCANSLELGAVDYIAKPVNPQILLHKVKIFQELQKNRKQLEKIIKDKDSQLFHSDNIYKLIFNNISIGVVLINSKMQIIDSNPVIKKWHAHKDLKNKKKCFEIFYNPAKSNICYNCPVLRCFKDGETHSEIQQNTKKNREYFFHVTACPIKNKENKVTNVIVLIEDVTKTEQEKIKIEKQLEIAKLKLKDNKSFGLCKMVGVSSKMQLVYKQIQEDAKNNLTVLIQGETGTGKELAAQAIHELSERKKEKFITIQCGALPETLLESNLFGHVKGAFTGAVSDKLGLFECADKGTIFLDEIELASPKMQATLLRVIENKEIIPIGSTNSKKIDIKIIVASNMDLEKMVSQKTFREDLFYRITESSIFLPPLRKRTEDLEILANSFFANLNLNRQFSLSPKTIEILTKYSWSGNIREYKNLITELATKTKHSIIRPADLPEKYKNEDLKKEIISSIYDQEKKLLEKVLKFTSDNKSEAAKILGISRPTIYALKKKYKL